MKIQGENSETGEEYQAEASHVNSEFIKTMSEFDMSDDHVKKLIDNLNISADAKSLIYSFSKATIRAGEYILKIGRKIIDLVLLITKEFPSATFGMIFGAIAGFLISSIPIIGVVLGTIFTPIAVLLGLTLGLSEDIKNKALIRKISEINASFSPLNTH